MKNFYFLIRTIAKGAVSLSQLLTKNKVKCQVDLTNANNEKLDSVRFKKRINENFLKINKYILD